MKRLLILSVLFTLIYSCKKDFEGDRNSAGLPETYAVVDSVRRDSVNHFLITTVQAYWWGSASKGFITGYEVSTDGMQTWKFTKSQSGTFLLELPPGQKSGIIPIYIRAIDNYGNRDASPANMVFPIVNSSPDCSLDPDKPTPDQSFPVIKFSWQCADIDGITDIDHYEMSLNQINDSTKFFHLPGNMIDEMVNETTAVVSVRIEGIRTTGLFTNNCLVYQGSKTTSLPGVLAGMKYDSINVIYMRAVDRTGNISKWVKDSLKVIAPKSDLLFVNAMYANGVLMQNFYLNTLAKPLVGISNIEILRGVNSLSGNSELYTDAITQQRTFNLFNKIIWITDDPGTLSIVQLTTAGFFNAGGRMFIYTQIGDDYPVNSQVFNFTPVSSLVDPHADTTIINGRFRMDNTCSAKPVFNGWPTLNYSGSIASARPFLTNTTSTSQFSYDSLMSAVVRIQSSSGSPYWTGPSTMMSRRVRISAGKTDMILTSLPLQNLNGYGNIDSLFQKIFIDELNF